MIRAGRLRVRKQNTYQICPQPIFTFSRHCHEIRELLLEELKTFVESSSLNPDNSFASSFTDWMDSLRDMVVMKEQKIFPRHKLVVHGIVGTLNDNEPTICFGTHTFMSLDCGDGSVGVNYHNAKFFAAVMVAGFCVD
ncbi:unnamed protein product [Calicophoron daubneyi]|uniref:Uncharacterized protein n=1 Tax=Calicophoron daubneyi TaxID=300641 RepID=A0AAV2TD76_CALDB